MFGRDKKEEPGRTIDVLLEEARRDLEHVGDMENLAHNPGWLKLRGCLERQAAQLQAQVNKLAPNPVKNENELRDAASLRAAIQGLLDIFDVTIGEGDAVRQEVIQREMQMKRAAETNDRFAR
jgi:hypothetical protein